MKRKIGNSWGVGGYTWPLLNGNSEGVGGGLIGRTIGGRGMDIFWNHSLLGRDDRWCHNARHMMSFVQKIFIGSLRTGQNNWPDWFTSHQSHYYVTMAYQPVYEETCDVNIKIAQTTQSIWILLSESQGYWRKGNLWQLSRRYSSKTGVSQIILGSGWHCIYPLLDALQQKFCEKLPRP